MSDTPAIAAYHCLKQARIVELPINLHSILASFRIALLSYTEFAGRADCTHDDVVKAFGSLEGGSLVIGNVRTIGYNEEQAPSRTRFTIAHEFGHIALGHDRSHPSSEEAANIFARNLLAPPAAFEMWRSPNDKYPIRYASWYFDISKTCTQNRMKHLGEDIAELKDAGLYDAQREQFEPFIRDNPLGKQTGNVCVNIKGKQCGVNLPADVRVCPLCGNVTRAYLQAMARQLDGGPINKPGFVRFGSKL